ncbi:RNA polymerase sigma factor [Croceibacterium sp. TMG7-5b_MA50]|uniref:RNA polymerase sigma factor n=1 Tax=Croceibacterium sp. TMG7-5b_MA50 TaxID=3121290 RepID=UPI0032218848
MADTPPSSGLQAAFLQHRAQLLRFVAARGAGDEAEDVLQDVWLRIAATQSGPVASPLAYLYRAANTVLIDRYRARRQAVSRDRAWSDTQGAGDPLVSAAPSAERTVLGRNLMAAVEALLADLHPPRVSAIFRRHRVDGIAQRQIAAEFGVSLSTVESDLRIAYRALAELREQFDAD